MIHREAGGRVVPRMDGLLVVINRAAGTADDESVEAALGVLRRGADVSVVATADQDLGRRA